MIVTVRNELTGEVVHIEVESMCAPEGQDQALRYAFRNMGWRKCVAFSPLMGEQGNAA